MRSRSSLVSWSAVQLYRNARHNTYEEEAGLLLGLEVSRAWCLPDSAPMGPVLAGGSVCWDCDIERGEAERLITFWGELTSPVIHRHPASSTSQQFQHPQSHHRPSLQSQRPLGDAQATPEHSTGREQGFRKLVLQKVLIEQVLSRYSHDVCSVTFVTLVEVSASTC
jgi:hypothetical protein